MSIGDGSDPAGRPQTPLDGGRPVVRNGGGSGIATLPGTVRYVTGEQLTVCAVLSPGGNDGAMGRKTGGMMHKGGGQRDALQAAAASLESLRVRAGSSGEGDGAPTSSCSPSSPRAPSSLRAAFAVLAVVIVATWSLSQCSLPGVVVVVGARLWLGCGRVVHIFSYVTLDEAGRLFQMYHRTPFHSL